MHEGWDSTSIGRRGDGGGKVDNHEAKHTMWSFEWFLTGDGSKEKWPCRGLRPKMRGHVRLKQGSAHGVVESTNHPLGFLVLLGGVGAQKVEVSAMVMKKFPMM